jgi:hypothetical protein
MEWFEGRLYCRCLEVWNVLSDSTVTLFIGPGRIVTWTLKMEAACFCYNFPLQFFFGDSKIKYYEMNDSINFIKFILIFVCHSCPKPDTKILLFIPCIITDYYTNRCTYNM